MCETMFFIPSSQLKVVMRNSHNNFFLNFVQPLLASLSKTA